MESNLGSKAGDLVALLSGHIGEHSVCAWGNLAGQVDVLGEGHLALLERTLEICLANRVAAIGLLVDEGDEAVLDLEMHLEALLNLVLEVTAGLDGESLATEKMLV